MIINSSLPPAGFLPGNAKTSLPVRQQDSLSYSENNRNHTDNGIAQQQLSVIPDNERSEHLRSERIDLRVLRSEAESLHHQRALAVYRVTAGLTDSDTASGQSLGLDLFV